MMYYGRGLSLGACAALCGVAVVIYFIMRSGMARRNKRILAVTLFGLTVAGLAFADSTGQGASDREWAESWRFVSQIPPPDVLETTGADEKSDSEDEAVSTSVEVRPGGVHISTPTVTIGSVEETDQATKSVIAVGKKRGRATAEASNKARTAEPVHTTRRRLAGSIGGFSLLLVLAYLFLDAGRRQRYIWPRRMVIAAAFVAVCAVFWRIVPLM